MNAIAAPGKEFGRVKTQREQCGSALDEGIPQRQVLDPPEHEGESRDGLGTTSSGISPGRRLVTMLSAALGWCGSAR